MPHCSINGSASIRVPFSAGSSITSNYWRRSRQQGRRGEGEKGRRGKENMETNMKRNLVLKSSIITVCLVFFSPSPLLPFSPSSCSADERTPEQLLPATTQIYARWDGVTAHKEAYRNSARGKM